MMKLEKIVILFLSIICLSNVGANDKENASLNDKVLSSHKNPPTQQNKTSSTFAANDIGPEVALPESNLELNHPQQNILDAEDIGSVKEYFYVLTSISLLVICLIVFRSMRMRKTRAEIKYGQADKSETQPLPTSMQFDSEEENDDQTLFDINQLRNSRSSIHLV